MEVARCSKNNSEFTLESNFIYLSYALHDNCVNQQSAGYVLVRTYFAGPWLKRLHQPTGKGCTM